MLTTDMMVRNRKINAVPVVMTVFVTNVISNIVSNAATKMNKWRQYYGKRQNT